MRNAGGVFLGERSFEVLGDYVAGPSHTMPTGGTARFASPLNVLDFVKIVSVIGLNEAALQAIGPAAETLARAEGLDRPRGGCRAAAAVNWCTANQLNIFLTGLTRFTGLCVASAETASILLILLILSQNGPLNYLSLAHVAYQRAFSQEEEMKPRFKFGLLVGLIGLVLNICVSGFIGFCGPFTALLAGALAAFLAARQEQVGSKAGGARLGAVAGAIAGALVLIGQMLGGVGALALFQFGNVPLPFGTAPSPAADVSQQILDYTAGLTTGLCFGLVGVALAAGAGALAGYLSTPERALTTTEEETAQVAD